MYALQMIDDRDNRIKVHIWSHDDSEGEDITTFIQYLYYDLYDYSLT